MGRDFGEPDRRDEAKGQISDTVDAHKSARLIGHMVTGAMQRAIVARDASALRECVDFISSELLPKT